LNLLHSCCSPFQSNPSTYFILQRTLDCPKLTANLSSWVSPGERVKEISDGKQCDAKNCTPQIEVMTHAVLMSPAHPSQPTKRLANMCKDDHHETSSAKGLHEGPRALATKEQDHRTRKQHARWGQCAQRST